MFVVSQAEHTTAFPSLCNGPSLRAILQDFRRLVISELNSISCEKSHGQFDTAVLANPSIRRLDAFTVAACIERLDDRSRLLCHNACSPYDLCQTPSRTWHADIKPLTDSADK